MIDPGKPVRFRGSVTPGHGRIRIIGNDGMGNHHVRYHDGKNWKSGRVDENGWFTGSGGSLIENYSIDWDQRIAFQDTAERGWLSHRTEGDNPIVFVTGAGDERYLYDQHGMPLARDGDFEIPMRPIMNVMTNSVEQDEARRRVEEKRQARRLEQEALQSNPLWGLF